MFAFKLFGKQKRLQLQIRCNLLMFSVGTTGFEPVTLPTFGRDALNLSITIGRAKHFSGYFAQ